MLCLLLHLGIILNYNMFIDNKKFLVNLILFSFLAIFYLPIITNAQPTPVTTGNPPVVTTGNPSSSSVIPIPNPFKCPNNNCSITAFIKTIINSILLPIGGVVAVLMIMYAGFLYVTARGNTSQIEKAHQALLYAVIGAAVLLGALVISEAIEGTIDQLKR